MLEYSLALFGALVTSEFEGGVNQRWKDFSSSFTHKCRQEGFQVVIAKDMTHWRYRDFSTTYSKQQGFRGIL